MAAITYNFKAIAPVPGADQAIDIILTRTQRRTPTVIHPGYAINRIRAFYMRKVKFTQQTASEKLGEILMQFPRLDDIHPFYADLMNILYDRDHYKLALGQINISKRLIDTLARDYVRLIKYGDSLYRCKQLKRAALGRMMTIIKRQKSSLSYLEEVRKHLSRLPSIDPNTRSLIVCGYPNVGKSSFMNKVTRADVDVQPYAFTTKSLFVGHMDYRYLRWQVIDTPGILDHPLDERNTIEMQAITALAHLQCTILYFIDISEQCGFTIPQQVALFESIKPLFMNKQLIIVINKIDIVPFDELPEAHRTSIEKLAEDSGVELLQMSNVSEEGVSAVKNRACDLLLQARVDARMAGKKVNDILNRLTVAKPDGSQGGAAAAEPFIPESVLAMRAAGPVDKTMKPKTEKDLMVENGGAGVYSMDNRKNYMLADQDWKYDVMPEIMDGKNVADFVDPDIAAKLDALEREQEQLEEEQAAAMDSDESDLDETDKALLQAIRDKKKIMKKEARINSTKRSATLPRSTRVLEVTDVVDHLEGVGVDSSGIAQRGRKRSRARADDDGAAEDGDAMETDEADGDALFASDASSDKKQKRARSQSKSGPSRSRSRSVVAKTPNEDGLKNNTQKKKALKMLRKVQKVQFGKHRRAGEADRSTGPKLDKHLLAGKMSNGTSRSR